MLLVLLLLAALIEFVASVILVHALMKHGLGRKQSGES